MIDLSKQGFSEESIQAQTGHNNWWYSDSYYIKDVCVGCVNQ